MSTTKRVIFLILFHSILYLEVVGQQWSPRFQYITADDGLSQNSINDIYQDELGFLWFATQDGLNRYDGYEFKVFRPNQNDLWSVSDNFITKIESDTNGNLWIHGRYGLNYFDPIKERFYKVNTSLKEDLSVPISTFTWSDKSYVNFAFETYELPGQIEDPLTILDKSLNLSDSIINTIIIDDHLIVATPGRLLKYNGDWAKIDSVELEKRIDQYQGIWTCNGKPVLCIGNELYRIKANPLKLDFWCSVEEGASIQDLEIMSDSSIWIAHTRGLQIQKDSQVYNISPDPLKMGGLSYPNVHSLYEDAIGNIWIGTANGGLNILPKGADRFEIISTENGLRNNQVWCAMHDAQGFLWIGTEDGLDIFRNGVKSDSLNEISDFFNGIRITAMTQDEDQRIWIGTSRRGLFRIENDKSISTLEIPGESKFYQSVSCFQQQGDTMWVGTLGKLNWVDSKDQVHDLSESQHASLRYILSLNLIGEELHAGSSRPYNIIDVNDLSCVEYAYEPNSGIRGPNFQFATGIEKGLDSTIWLSTFGGGLNQFNREEESFSFYRSTEGLSNEVLASMVQTEEGLWVSHNEGLSHFDSKTKRFRNFDLSHGVPFKEFSMGGGGKMNDGRIFFGGTGGLVILEPKSFPEDSFAIKPIITEISFNYDSVVNDSKEIDWLELTPEIKVVSFRFAAFDFMQSKNLRYQYKLEGFDDNWVVSTVAERRATYSNLPSGDYQFRVRVGDENGLWSSNEAEFAMQVIPPIWFRLWFILTAIGFATLLVIILVRYYYRVKTNRQLRDMEMQHRVHRERERISMDLHDHVGAQITYLISNLDRMGLENRHENQDVEGLGKYAREAMRELRDTVWAIRRDSMPLQEMKQRIGQFGNSLFQNTDTKLSINANNLEVVLQPAPALHLLRILQESLHNIHKHANAKNAIIEFSVTNQVLTLRVKDDGLGITAQENDGREHNGVRNMKDRASEIGAVFSVVSKVKKGTEVTVILNLKDKASASFIYT